jgi:hypothetical protein
MRIMRGNQAAVMIAVGPMVVVAIDAVLDPAHLQETDVAVRVPAARGLRVAVDHGQVVNVRAGVQEHVPAAPSGLVLDQAKVLDARARTGEMRDHRIVVRHKIVPLKLQSRRK